MSAFFKLASLVAVTTVLVASAGSARADDAAASDPAAAAEAKTHFEAGRAAYMAGDYQGAIGQFQMAQAIRPSPILDYNIGLAYEGLGDAANAVDSYERYITLKPDASNRADVEARVAALQQAARLQRAQPPRPQPQRVQQQPDPNQGLQQPPPGGYYPPPPRSPTSYHAAPVERTPRWVAPVIVVSVIAGVVLTGTIVIAAALAGSSSYSSGYLSTAPEHSLAVGAARLPLLPSGSGLPNEQPALLRF